MNIYTEIILEHFKNPKNYGRLDKKTRNDIGKNNTCGDKITIDLLIEKETLKDIAFEGQGCAISIASMSILSEKIKGLPISEIEKLNEEDIKKFLKIDISHGRMNCAMLGLKTLKQMLKGEEENGSCIPCSSRKK